MFPLSRCVAKKQQEEEIIANMSESAILFYNVTLLDVLRKSELSCVIDIDQ